MSSFYSDFKCTSCKNLEKVIVDIDDGVDSLILPGEAATVNENCTTVCPFCNAQTTSKIVSKNGTFIGIFSMQTDSKELVVRSLEATLNDWKSEKSSLLIFDEPFANHPLKPNELFSKDGIDYKIVQTFIREWTERDVDQRMEMYKGHSYCYKLLDPSGEVFWLQVEQGDIDNAQLNKNNGIILKDFNDEVYDISEDTSYPTEIFSTDWFNGLILKVNQYKSGYEFIVTNHRGDVDFNGLFDTFAEGLTAIEENIVLAL